MPAPKPSIDTCHHCGKLFPRLGVQLCSVCAPSEDHRFELVKDFVAHHDGAAVSDIARGTGVTMADVRTFLDSGRLIEFTGNSCTCGGRGERCKACRAELAAPLRNLEQRMSTEHAQRRTTRGTGSWNGAANEPAAGSGDAESSGRTSYVRRIRRIGDA